MSFYLQQPLLRLLLYKLEAANLKHLTQNNTKKKYQKLFVVEFVKILIVPTILTDDFLIEPRSDRLANDA